MTYVSAKLFESQPTVAFTVGLGRDSFRVQHFYDRESSARRERVSETVGGPERFGLELELGLLAHNDQRTA